LSDEPQQTLSYTMYIVAEKDGDPLEYEDATSALRAFEFLRLGGKDPTWRQETRTRPATGTSEA
jgi:hypothetical protein